MKNFHENLNVTEACPTPLLDIILWGGGRMCNILGQVFRDQAIFLRTQNRVY